MLISDIKRIIDQVSRDKGIDPDILIQAVEEALKSAARKKYGNRIDIETQYNTQTGEIEIYQYKKVVENIQDEDTELSFQEARLLDPECELDDSLGIKMDTASFGRIAAQSAKQVIIQKIKDAEREAVYSHFSSRKGEIIHGVVQRVERGDVIVNLGPVEALLPGKEQIPREIYRRGDRVRAFILDINQNVRGPQIILTRTHPNFLITLFKTEVPEISEGIVTIMGAVRDPGIRAKIAVASNDSDIDPVGACVGMKGTRVQNVVQELRGEKIDIISWNMDPAKYVCNALAPAEISRVIIDEEHTSMEVIVPDEYLSISIGKRGQNVRLASKLTGWRLDVKNESDYSQALQTAFDDLMMVPEMTIFIAESLHRKGIMSLDDLACSGPEDLTEIQGVDEELANRIIGAAQEGIPETGELAKADGADSEDGEDTIVMIEEQTQLVVEEQSSAKDDHKGAENHEN